MRSILNKFSELEAHLALLKRKISFVLITETWLSPSNDINFELNGYKSVSVYRDGRGGGLKLFYLEHLSVSLLDYLSNTSGSCESLFIETRVAGMGRVVVGGVYRPPGNSVHDFLIEFNNMLNICGNRRTIFLF